MQAGRQEGRKTERKEERKGRRRYIKEKNNKLDFIKDKTVNSLKRYLNE